MSQLVWLEGKDTTQSAHCALVRCAPSNNFVPTAMAAVEAMGVRIMDWGNWVLQNTEAND